MKNILFLAAALLCGAVLFADDSAKVFDWSLLWSGSWEESASTPLKGNLYNRGEVKLQFFQPGILLRGQVLDRRALNFNLDPPWGDAENGITNFTGALYHKPTGSRLLFGVLDEWGLSARIRNPWIRSPPYAENHSPLIADLKTSASGTKEDEAYLYLSSQLLEIHPDVKLRAFLSAQTETAVFTPAISGGADFVFAKNTGLLFEAFYTADTLPPTKSSSWFSDPPPLPEREFRLYAAGLLFSNQDFSVSTDFAVSETFAWGTDIYFNMGFSLTPSLSFGNRARPLTVSLAVDGAGARFVYRDGANHGEGFRSAAKIELKGARNSLLRINTVLRGPRFGEDFNRGSAGFYYRFQSASRDGGGFPIRLARISMSADRNAVNLSKISDGISGYIGFSVNLREMAANSPIGINLSGSIKWLTAADGSPFPYPILEESSVFDTASISCELIWPVGIFQFRSKTGCTFTEGKDERWDFSVSASVRFSRGRLSLKASSADFPERWSWTASWRLEKR